MGMCLLDRMASVVEEAFKADRALRSCPSLDTLQKARQARKIFHDTELREYRSMVVDGVWDQDACNMSTELAVECTRLYNLWLGSVEKDLLLCLTAGYTAPAPVVIPMKTSLPTPVPLPVSTKPRDKAFF